jgi:putative membrane protein
MAYLLSFDLLIRFIRFIFNFFKIKKSDMKLLSAILLNGLLVFVIAKLLPGVFVVNYWMAVLTGIVLGLINITVKPLVTVLTLPITIFSLGFFLLIINGVMVLLVDSILQGFEVRDLWSAIIFSILLSLFNLFLENNRKTMRRT